MSQIIIISVFFAVQTFANGLANGHGHYQQTAPSMGSHTGSTHSPQQPVPQPFQAPAQAVNQQPQVQMLGAGSRSCQQFLQIMATQDTSSKIAFYSWVQGYASAASAVLGKSTFANAQKSLQFVDQQIVQECQRAPGVGFGHAADKALQRKLGQIK